MKASGLISRRAFCKLAGGGCLAAGTVANLAFARRVDHSRALAADIAAFDRNRVMNAAQSYLKQSPITITSVSSDRSPGQRHDYYSEADYYWPDPNNPKAPYVVRDGMSNPSNFVEHRRLLLRFSVQVPALTAAWRIGRDSSFANHAADHLRAWFVNPDTRMNPSLQYSQAIRGGPTGTPFGLIDFIHLVEIARSVEALESSTALSQEELAKIHDWFASYLHWMTTYPTALEERDSKNNHATCWVMQLAAFAQLTKNQDLLDYARTRFKTVLVPDQMANYGGFPRELHRTKPYGYSLFNLDAMATICQLLSSPAENLWDFELPDGRCMRKAVSFMVPYIRDKHLWPLAPDVMYFNDWPMRQCSLLFGGDAFDRPDYIELWKKLPADSTVEEVIRNFFVRQPVLWV